MTISFEVMMRALAIQLAKPHYIHVLRGHLTLDHDTQVNLKIILTKEFQDQEFDSAHDFAEKTNEFIGSMRKASYGYRKVELSAMKTILLHSGWGIEYQEELIKSELEKEIFAALIDDQNEGNPIYL